ncbi:MAG: FixH family protein [Candidatus Marinimicrobia bacterium]|nr:FixH family protein [Candidatus Neomarinimicrobiota bacterium]
MKLRIFLAVLVGSFMVITSCADTNNDEDQTENLVLVGSRSDNGLTVKMFTDDSLIVGLNKLYIRLIDESSGEMVTEAHITHVPIMRMATMQHSCPVTNAGVQANDDDLFESELVFSMASGMLGTWDDTVSVNNELAGTMHKVVFENLSVMETDMKKDLVTYAADSNQVFYVITLNGLSDPQVGSNDFTLTVHQKTSMMSFPEAADMVITVDPQMPSMGHGSDGNIDPEYTENGKYEGIVTFSMTGYWTVDFSFAQNGEELGTVQYEFTL